MDAGRDLDALVAYHVFGWFSVRSTIEPPVIIPEFSTDLTAAWWVVEKLLPDHHHCFDLTRRDNDEAPWTARFYGASAVDADTVPLAICLAALAACNVEVS